MSSYIGPREKYGRGHRLRDGLSSDEEEEEGGDELMTTTKHFKPRGESNMVLHQAAIQKVTYPEDLIFKVKKQNKRMNTTVKCVLVGNAGVGKTALCRKLDEGVFETPLQNTIGVDYHKISTETHTVAVWDTAGAERFRNIVSAYFEQGTVVLVAFSLQRISTLYDVPQWIKDVRRNNRDCLFVVVGCKSDLRNVEQARVRKYLQDADVETFAYFECSAKNDDREELCARLLEHLPPMEKFQIEEGNRKDHKAARKREREYYCPGGCRLS